MTLKTKLARTVPFAHLLGIRAEGEPTEDDDEREEKLAGWRAKGEEDDERRQCDDESDDDYIERMEELDEKEEKDAQRAEKDKKDEEAEDEGGDEDAKAARRAERARCATIIAHGIKTGCVNQAGVFAFDTNLSAQAAIAALNAGRLDGNTARRGGLADRMAGVKSPNPGASGGQSLDPSDPKAVADRVIAAAKKARGES